MSKLKMSINIKTRDDLNLYDIYCIMQDIRARTEGYKTEVPKQLINADLNIDENFFVDGIKKNLFDELENEKKKT